MIRISPKVAAAAIILSAVAGWTTGGYAAETKEVTRTVTVYSLETDAPDFYKAVKAVCSDEKVKLSDKAKTACKANEFPKLTKALKFRNAGIGAEFNTLAAQR